MGAIFKLKIDIVDDFIGTINELKAQNKEILSATLGEKSLILGEKALNSNTVVIIGNEGHGLSKDVISISNDTIFIPIKENTESLNAAMASVIFMWELSK
ncbi:MAG: RNA methyltransferase, partial [Clostridia bacterium]|nr:RNA methyltransferase [Clostridia bacterium]